MPSPSQPTYPTLSWSHSRDRTFRECARRYYLRYYHATGGWRPDARRSSRLASALGYLTSLEATVGMVVHDRARELAMAVRAGGRSPDLDAMLASSRHRLNALWLMRDRRAFLRAPRDTPMLIDHWYRTPIIPDRVARLRHRLATALRTLRTHTIWDELRSATLGEVAIPVGPVSAMVDGAMVYATPDLWSRAGPEAPWVLTEWKTGSDATAREQLALYAVVLRARERTARQVAPLLGRVIRLDVGVDEWIELTQSDLDAAHARIRDGLRAMRARLRDLTANVPLEPDAFPPSARTSRCGWCAYRTLCPDGRAVTQARSPLHRTDGQ